MDVITARRAAMAAPEDPVRRLAYAGVLLDAGRRAAAWHELQVALRLGGEDPVDLRGRFTVENPAGMIWHFVPFAADSTTVATGDLADQRFPGIEVSCGGRSLPLVVLLGRHCVACDDRGETVCTDCGGTGWRAALFGDDEVPCPERDTCLECGGTKYVLNTARSNDGSCAHAYSIVEGEGPGWQLERCPGCGLAAISCFPLWSRLWACAGCGLFDCSCRRPPLPYEST